MQGVRARAHAHAMPSLPALLLAALGSAQAGVLIFMMCVLVAHSIQ